MFGLVLQALAVPFMVLFCLENFSSCMFGLVWQALAVACMVWFGMLWFDQSLRLVKPEAKSFLHLYPHSSGANSRL